MYSNLNNKDIHYIDLYNTFYLIQFSFSYYLKKINNCFNFRKFHYLI